MQNKRNMVLCILDGFGLAPESATNAITTADTPHLDMLFNTMPWVAIEGSGEYVGLPPGQMGNSEVGHMNIGAGRILYQDLTRIRHTIETGQFTENPALKAAIHTALQTGKKLHILGLFSAGGVHSHESHFYTVLEAALALGLKDIHLHLFLDGRDTPPKSAKPSLAAMEAFLEQKQLPQIASIAGRFYAMDRDKRFERTQKAFDMLCKPAPSSATTAIDALEAAYARGETDEFVAPEAISATAIADGDVVLCMNFRSDRMRQLCFALSDPNYACFTRNLLHIQLYTLTQYHEALNATPLFPPQSVAMGLSETISAHALKQLKIAETEKYAHVTFFFNGGYEPPFEGEERILIPSPKVATYDLQPEMSAYTITEQLVDAIRRKEFALIVCNFANADMVGHTGNLEATQKAIATLDACLSQISAAILETDAEMIITADHGNAECMYNAQTQQAHTAHTSEPVPFLLVSQDKTVQLGTQGKLCDIAPTILERMGLAQPQEMTGVSLIKKLASDAKATCP